MIHANGPRTGRPPALGRRGMVSSPHYLASGSGLDVLRRGGSAVDAAIATNATLCVVYPHMAGLGGDAFWLIAGGAAQGVQALQACGPAGALADMDFYRGKGHAEAIPARGALAALTVPGAVDGWRLAHERYGKLPWASLFADAIEYARHGAPVSRSLADWLAADAAILAADPGMAGIYLPEGKPQREGSYLVQADLARTLETLARLGPREGFYEGEAAREICRYLEAAGGPLRAADFERYRAEWVQPISGTYRGYEVFQMPPPTQGIAALQILKLLEQCDVAAWGAESADYYHHVVEAIKIAFADRDEWLSDPAYVDMPLAALLSSEYCRQRHGLIRSESALALDRIEAGIKFGGAASRKSPDGDTVYFCVADADGLVVSTIQSIYHDFGAAVVGGNTGVILQNRGSFFSLDAEHPNCLQPGKHTFHTLVPAMLMKDGQPVLAYGTMGGEGQPQTQAALLTRMVDFGYDVQQAIEAPRWLMGRTWGMSSRDLWLEARIADETLRELRLRGHPVKTVPNWDGTLGHAQAIRIDPVTRAFEGGADPRGDGAALGF
ncbi:gamma-glutamyltransferase [Bordetella bronchiseptica]|uniref:gamma-glutamyltransferase n=1 Tax=Bordetella bronchiseptica TaxID=518 RepID=UPI00028F62C0|nr:gamma-glutamyltransferase [Bordetella bronchiseptica]KAK68366.1 gamma-glutamyltransferase [Bordetella bronchiseptica MO211]CCN20242.1 gamma-glutamyltranspeptidase precursor [Bordetella bronchiseptica MO211]